MKFAPTHSRAVQTFAAVAAKFSGAGLAFVWQLLVFRLLGVTGGGIYALGVSAFRLSGTIGSFGTDRAMIAELPHQLANRRKHAVAQSLVAATMLTFAISVAMALVMGMGVIIGLPPGHPFRSVILLVAAFVMIGALLNLAAGALRALGRVVLADIVFIVIPPGISLLVLGAMLFTTDVPSAPKDAFLIFATGQIAGLVVAVINLRRFIQTSWPSIWKRVWRRVSLFRKRGGAYLIAALSTGYLPDILTILVGGIAGPQQAAVLAISMRYVLLVRFVSASIIQNIEPALSRALKSGNKGTSETLVRKAVLVQAGVMTPICVLAIVLSGPALGVFDASLEFYRGVLILLLMGELVNAYTGISGSVLILTGRVEKFGRYALGGGLIALVICAGLASVWGAYAGALATLAAIIFTKTLAQRLVYRTQNIRADVVSALLKRPA